MILDSASGVSLNWITNKYRSFPLANIFYKKQKTQDSLFLFTKNQNYAIIQKVNS